GSSPNASASAASASVVIVTWRAICSRMSSARTTSRTSGRPAPATAQHSAWTGANASAAMIALRARTGRRPTQATASAGLMIPGPPSTRASSVPLSSTTTAVVCVAPPSMPTINRSPLIRCCSCVNRLGSEGRADATHDQYDDGSEQREPEWIDQPRNPVELLRRPERKEYHDGGADAQDRVALTRTF